LRELLHYDPVTGHFTWRVDRGRIKAGSRAGCADKSRCTPYRFISIDHKLHREHRLAWLWMNGEWPDRLIDHINGDGSDNRWSNLRLATAMQNAANNRRETGKSGLRGVYHREDMDGRFQAKISITLNGRKRVAHLGFYSTAQEAHEAYKAAATRQFGEFSPYPQPEPEMDLPLAA
jgi:hypothetical protein